MQVAADLSSQAAESAGIIGSFGTSTVNMYNGGAHGFCHVLSNTGQWPCCYCTLPASLPAQPHKLDNVISRERVA